MRLISTHTYPMPLPLEKRGHEIFHCKLIVGEYIITELAWRLPTSQERDKQWIDGENLEYFTSTPIWWLLFKPSWPALTTNCHHIPVDSFEQSKIMDAFSLFLIWKIIIPFDYNCFKTCNIFWGSQHPKLENISSPSALIELLSSRATHELS